MAKWPDARERQEGVRRLDLLVRESEQLLHLIATVF
jgi:hypothetical protein